MKTLKPAEAERKGLRPLAGPYCAREDWMAQNVMLDMRRGGKPNAKNAMGSLCG